MRATQARSWGWERAVAAGWGYCSRGGLRHYQGSGRLTYQGWMDTLPLPPFLPRSPSPPGSPPPCPSLQQEHATLVATLFSVAEPGLRELSVGEPAVCLLQSLYSLQLMDQNRVLSTQYTPTGIIRRARCQGCRGPSQSHNPTTGAPASQPCPTEPCPAQPAPLSLIPWMPSLTVGPFRGPGACGAGSTSRPEGLT